MIAINPEGKHRGISVLIIKFQSRILQYVDCYKLSLCKHSTIPVFNICDIEFLTRAPDNFLKQGVADASLEAKGGFLQKSRSFFTPKFYTRVFL